MRPVPRIGSERRARPRRATALPARPRSAAAARCTGAVAEPPERRRRACRAVDSFTSSHRPAACKLVSHTSFNTCLSRSPSIAQRVDQRSRRCSSGTGWVFWNTMPMRFAAARSRRPPARVDRIAAQAHARLRCAQPVDQVVHAIDRAQQTSDLPQPEGPITRGHPCRAESPSTRSCQRRAALPYQRLKSR